MILYISGPMSGYEDLNASAFNQTANRLREEGHIVANPIELDGRQKNGRYAEYLMRDLRIVAEEVDALVMLTGWEGSRGAKLEAYTAKMFGKPLLTPTLKHLPQVRQAPGFQKEPNVPLPST